MNLRTDCWRGFGPLKGGDLHELLFVLIQERTVMEYREKFELLSGV